MKILLITFSDNADHQDTLYGMYEQLKGAYDVRFIGIRNPKIPMELSENTWLVDCPARPGICKKTFDLRLLLRIISYVNKNKFDVVYFESLHIWNLAVMLFSSKGIKVFQCIHEVIPHEGDRQEKMVHLMNKLVARLADVIVLRNQTYIQQMSERYKISAERIRYLELWRRYPAYTPPVFSQKVLFFGRINPYKGAANLLEIATVCSGVEFVVMGRAEPAMLETVQRLSALPNVSVRTDYVSDDEMARAFIDCDWVVLPYKSASQSGVVIDAYKYGRPVVCFDVGAISEQVQDGKTGYLIRANDNKGFIEALGNALAMSRERYTQMSREAYRYGYDKYASQAASKRFLEVICSK